MTAVEWFSERIQSNIIFNFENVLKKALEMEKQQIIDARVNGVAEGIDIGSNPITEDISKNHEIYYNQTFNK
jgi:hypothetical protein